MKITWFGGSTFRIYTGGQIIVADAELAPSDLAHEELVAGADTLLTLAGGTSYLPPFHAENWHAKQRLRLIDQQEENAVSISGVAGTGVLVESTSERPLLLLPHPQDDMRNVISNAFVVLFGAPQGIEESVAKLLSQVRPPLIGLATEELSASQMSALAQMANGVSIQVLEHGLALEM